MTTVDDLRHPTVSVETGNIAVNMALAISAPDLHKKCCQETDRAGLTAKEMLSFSWFKLQFWPKDATIHSSLNYMGRFSVKYMIQQHMVRKAQDDFHYTGVGYKYAKEYVVSICDLASFIWTNDMISIKYSWRTWFLSYCFILRALGSCWKKMKSSRLLLMTSQIYYYVQPLFWLITHISESIEDSWYKGKPNVLLTVTTISSSSTVRTAPGHSYCNLAEKINCILNLGLYNIGVLKKLSINLKFEHKLKNRSGLSNVCKLVDNSPEKSSIAWWVMQALHPTAWRSFFLSTIKRSYVSSPWRNAWYR